MTAEPGFSLYTVIDEGTRDVLVAAEEVAGFFVDPDDERDEVTFSGLRFVDSRRRKTDDAVLEIANRRGEKIGEYFVGRAELCAAGSEVAGDETSRASYRVFGTRCEFPAAAPIWRRWALGADLKKDEWLRLPINDQDAWLHVVQNSWFATGRRAARYGTDDVALLNGSHISTRTGFYCAIGEAVNGPGGYFGSNLDALADCISSGSGAEPALRIVWRNFRSSEVSVGREFLTSVMAVFREFGVAVDTR
jgi:RNAse (barnase) inhibitor barstar